MHESLGGLPVLLSDSYESELKLALVQVECFPCIIVGNHTFLLQSCTEKMSQHSRVLLKILKKKKHPILVNKKNLQIKHQHGFKGSTVVSAVSDPS